MAQIPTTIVIPNLDNDGQPFPPRVIDELQRRLQLVQLPAPSGVGWSARTVSGVWVSPGGQRFDDDSLEYVVGLDSWMRVVRWYGDVVQWARVAFRQEAIYFSVLGIAETYPL